MSLKEIQERASGNRIDLQELPEEIRLRIKEYEWKKDKNNRDVLQIDFETEEEIPRLVTQKYSANFLSALAAQMEQLQVANIKTYMSKFTLWKLQDKRNVKMGYPRLMPTEKP